MPRRLLVTGAGGYIGSITSHLLLENGFDIVALDNFTTGYKKPLELLQEKFAKSRVSIYEKSTTEDLSKVFENEKDIIGCLHFAASLSVNDSMANPLEYFKNNFEGTRNLLENLLKFNVKNIVFSSTCATFGNADYLPLDEVHPQNPVSVYGESKVMVEKMIKWLGELKGLKYVILRYFNVCGALEDGSLGDAKKPSPHLMQNAVRGALGIEPFKLTYGEVDTPDKSPIRDYVDVRDLASAHLRAIHYLFEGKDSNDFNLGTGEGNSVLEIIKVVEKVTGKEIELTKGETRKGDTAKVFASTKKAKEVLGWEATKSLEDSVRSLVTWYNLHPDGWGG
ncbi:MAG: UDP-glucose 4-epimerase GalE [bacterium]|nr:UDP-glucose 4-epimerase GalE [bacterium]